MIEDHFESLDEFYNLYYERRPYPGPDYMDIDFCYKGKFYWYMEEGVMEEDFPNSYHDGGDYAVRIAYELIPEEGKPMSIEDYDFHKCRLVLVGKYRLMEDILNDWIIDGKPFKDVLIDGETHIYNIR